MNGHPKAVILLSGKRKSGKDFVAAILQKEIAPSIVAFRIAEPIKRWFAKQQNLDLDKLLDATVYKEQYRLEMVKWSEEKRRSDPNCFLRLAIEEADATKYPVWMLTDARRKVDVEFFRSGNQFQKTLVQAVRIRATDETRKSRGWQFTDGIDNKETECGLDQYEGWDLLVDNDGTEDQLKEQIQPLIDKIKALL